MDLLRFSTAGSVDDGKSTLIGRLLYDAKGVFEDQLEALQRSSLNRSAGPVDLSLLTDGLRAEREQGITIDVAYRYFATPRRKFIIADTPGHEQYTRNMATGSSTAHLSIVLIDARHGALVQSRRHTILASLLGIPHLIVAVNKMDLVGWDAAVFERIRMDFQTFVDRLGFTSVQFIPVSALNGDNVVERSTVAPWYDGPSLLQVLETVEVATGVTQRPLRFPVQRVVRPDLDFRGFAGQITSGRVRVGDEVVALPAGTRSRIKRIWTFDGDLDEAFAPQSVTLLLEDEIDVSRGDLLAHPQARPRVAQAFDAKLVWMDATPLDLARPYLIKHTTRTVRARVTELRHRIDVNTLQAAPTHTQRLNEITQVRLATAQPVFVDAYREDRATGSFILIDPETHATVAAGMVDPARPEHPDEARGTRRVDRARREVHANHRMAVVWLTAPAGAPRTHLARALEARLFRRGVQAFVLDDAAVREVSGVPEADSAASGLHRVAMLCRMLLNAGVLVVADVSATTREDRDTLRDWIGRPDWVEVALAVPGPSEGPWQPASAPDLVLEAALDLDAQAARVATFLNDRGLLSLAVGEMAGAGI